MIIFQTSIRELDVTTNKDVYYLVTGNDKQVGMSFVGDNVLYIRMKKAPGSDDSSFWLDDMFKVNISKFDSDLRDAKKLLERGGVVVISPSLLGEDIDKMKSVCPKTAGHIETKLRGIFHDKRQV